MKDAMEVEILWNSDPTRDFFEDLKAFANSLDDYRIVWDLTKTGEEKSVYLKDGSYEILYEQKPDAFECPNCGTNVFEVMEGELNEKPVLGLCCGNCDTYGAVFPRGL
jgi:hypothetical protein